jgi:acyl dehydratase
MTAVIAGTLIPAIQRRIEIADMVAYAGATWDWHRMHYDMAYVESAGFEAPIVDGQMLGALMAECVQDWLGPDARLTTLGFRFVTPVVADSVVRCDGVVESADSSNVKCALTVHIVGTYGSIIGTAATGQAEVSLS